MYHWFFPLDFKYNQELLSGINILWKKIERIIEKIKSKQNSLHVLNLIFGGVFQIVFIAF